VQPRIGRSCARFCCWQQPPRQATRRSLPRVPAWAFPGSRTATARCKARRSGDAPCAGEPCRLHPAQLGTSSQRRLFPSVTADAGNRRREVVGPTPFRPLPPPDGTGRPENAASLDCRPTTSGAGSDMRSHVRQARLDGADRPRADAAGRGKARPERRDWPRRRPYFSQLPMRRKVENRRIRARAQDEEVRFHLLRESKAGGDETAGVRD